MSFLKATMRPQWRRMLTPALLGLFAGSHAPHLGAQAAPGVPLMKPPLQAVSPSASPTLSPPSTSSAAGSRAAAAVAGARTIGWNDLTPPDWDPFKEFRQLDLMAYQDGDPRLQPLMSKMREIWDNAPVNPALVGQSVRLPGYVVPLEESREGLSEFLLVPYFGACIHSPPPPANQIVHVRLRSPMRGVRSMDTVWASGALSTVKSQTYMGAASWRMEAAVAAPYAERAPPR